METRKALLNEKFLEINIADEFLVADRFADLLKQFLTNFVLAFEVAQILGFALTEIHDDAVANLAACLFDLFLVVLVFDSET